MDNSLCGCGTQPTHSRAGAPAPPAPVRPYNHRRRRCPSLGLLLLAVLAGEAATPVRGILTDFSPPAIIQYGTCAHPKPYESFSFQQFGGLWYQVEMVPNSYMDAQKCITMDFQWNGVTAYNVRTEGLDEYNESVSQDATITQVQPEDPTANPHLQIRSYGVPRVPYHVIETDYHTHACVYSCYELFSLMFEAFSVLSRSPEIDPTSLDACYEAFDALGLKVTRLEPVEQAGDCLGTQYEGSGEVPGNLNDDGEEEEEEAKNALAALTSEEVNQRTPSNLTSVTRSELTEGEGGGTNLMQEEMKDLAEEVDRGRGRGGSASSSSSFPSQTRNRSEIPGSRVQSTAQDPLQRRPKKGRRKKPIKGRKKEEEEEEEEVEKDRQFYIDDLNLDILNDTKEQGKDGQAVITLSKGSQGLDEDSGGSFQAPAPLLLLGLLTLSLWSCLRPTLYHNTLPQGL